MPRLALSPPLGVRAGLAHAESAAAAGSASTPAPPAACDAAVWLRLRLRQPYRANPSPHPNPRPNLNPNLTLTLSLTRLLRLHAALLERARFGACGWQAAADPSATRGASSRLLALPPSDGDVACCLSNPSPNPNP